MYFRGTHLKFQFLFPSILLFWQLFLVGPLQFVNLVSIYLLKLGLFFKGRLFKISLTSLLNVSHTRQWLGLYLRFFTKGTWHQLCRKLWRKNPRWNLRITGFWAFSWKCRVFCKENSLAEDRKLFLGLNMLVLMECCQLILWHYRVKSAELLFCWFLPCMPWTGRPNNSLVAGLLLLVGGKLVAAVVIFVFDALAWLEGWGTIYYELI